MRQNAIASAGAAVAAISGGDADAHTHPEREQRVVPPVVHRHATKGSAPLGAARWRWISHGAMTFAVAPGDWVRNTVSSGGYPALAGLILAENLFPPIPSELILPLAGFYVGQGEMAFVLAVLAATIGSLAGALLLYAIARFGGRRLVLRFGKVLRVKEKDLDRADDWFDAPRRLGRALRAARAGRAQPGRASRPGCRRCRCCDSRRSPPSARRPGTAR